LGGRVFSSGVEVTLCCIDWNRGRFVVKDVPGGLESAMAEEKDKYTEEETSHPETPPHLDDSAELTASALENIHPSDVALQLEELNLDEQIRLVKDMSLDDAAESLVELEPRLLPPILTGLEPRLTARILEHMYTDDAADALVDVDEVRRNLIFRRMDRETAKELKELMRYDPHTAGGVMNTDIVILDQGLTVDQAIMILRTGSQDLEIPYYAYLVDENEILKGVASLRDILQSRPGTVLKDLVEDQQVISALWDVDREEVAHLIRHYNFVALPVVDARDKLLGVVTHDDVIDIIHEEASEDMLGMVGAGVDETVDTPWKESVVKRLPWLLINLANSAVAAYVVHLFEGTIAEMAILAALMHIVSNQAGNTGQQSLAVIIRQLAMERFDRRKSWLAVLREGKVGLANGIIIGIFVFLVVLLITQNVKLGQVMGLALGADMVIGALAGASIPLILKELGRDPAQASSIFLTTLTDAAGFFIFLGLAVLFLF
jgi:magnesium transporter